MVIRLISAGVALLSSFGIAISGYWFYLMLMQSTAILDRFTFFSWLIGLGGAITALGICSTRRIAQPGWWAFTSGLVGFAVPNGRFIAPENSLGTVMRAIIFFIHLPACILFGGFIGVCVYRRWSGDQHATPE